MAPLNRCSVFAVRNYIKNAKIPTCNPQRATRNAQLVTRHSNLSFGFTLLEIIITIFIFSIVVSTVLVSFNTILSTANAVDTDAFLYEMGKNCLNRMIIDLNAIYISQPPAYKVPDIDDPPDPYRFFGDASQAGATTFGRLRFASFSHLPFGNRTADGIAEITYYVKETEDQKYVLKRQDNLEPYPSFEEKNIDPILCRDVLSLSFAYVDVEDQEFENWDSESEAFDRATPIAVKIRLAFGDEERPLTFETSVSLPVYREKIE